MFSKAKSFKRTIASSHKLRVIEKAQSVADSIETEPETNVYRCMCGKKSVTCHVHRLNNILPEAHH